jgi:guanylate kinase
MAAACHSGSPSAGQRPKRRGRIFILSAPSGAGKTTLLRAALAEFGHMLYSVSYTTRPPRAGEINGRDYVFISPAEFEEGIQSGRWAEWARVHENYYGTSGQVLDQALAAGRDVLLEIDTQGARQIMSRFPESISIFIMPPSLEVLEARLGSRGTDSAEAIALRLDNARREMTHSGSYRHVIVNDDLNTATSELIAVLNSYCHPS